MEGAYSIARLVSRAETAMTEAQIQSDLLLYSRSEVSAATARPVGAGSIPDGASRARAQERKALRPFAMPVHPAIYMSGCMYMWGAAPHPQPHAGPRPLHVFSRPQEGELYTGERRAPPVEMATAMLALKGGDQPSAARLSDDASVGPRDQQSERLSAADLYRALMASAEGKAMARKSGRGIRETDETVTYKGAAFGAGSKRSSAGGTSWASDTQVALKPEVAIPIRKVPAGGIKEEAKGVPQMGDVIGRLAQVRARQCHNTLLLGALSWLLPHTRRRIHSSKHTTNFVWKLPPLDGAGQQDAGAEQAQAACQRSRRQAADAN